MPRLWLEQIMACAQRLIARVSMQKGQKSATFCGVVRRCNDTGYRLSVQERHMLRNKFIADASLTVRNHNVLTMALHLLYDLVMMTMKQAEAIKKLMAAGGELRGYD